LDADAPSSPGSRLHARARSGDGDDHPALLFVHGLGDGAHVWDATLDRLGPVGAVFSVDLPGHGDAPWRPGGGYSIETHASDLLAIITGRPVTRWILVGHSLGASVITRMALAEPSRIAGLVLVDPARQVAVEAVTRMLGDLRAIRGAGFQSVQAYEAELARQRPLAEPATVRQLARAALRRGEDGRFRVRFDPAVLDFDPADEIALAEAEVEGMRALRCPTLVIRGAGSAFLSRGAATHLAAEILAEGRLETIPRAGHAVMVDNPQALAEAIRRFVLSLA